MGKSLNFKAIAHKAVRSWGFWLVAMLVLGVCAYQFENWRGHRAWKHYVQAAKAKGLHLEWEECIPPQIPDSENFAMTPVLAQVYGLAPRTSGTPVLDLKQVLDTLNTNRVEPKAGDWIHGIPVSFLYCLTNKIPLLGLSYRNMSTAMMRRYGLIDSSVEANEGIRARQSNDLVILANYAAMKPREQAEKILAALAPLEPVWAELREAMKRPHCRYPYPYQQTLNNKPWPPHLDRIRDLSQWLRLWAICQLELGNHEAALEGIELGHYLGESVKNEPWVAANAVHVALGDRMNQVVWEGTRRHLWTDSELSRIQSLQPLTNQVAEAVQVVPRLRAVDLRRAEEEWESGITLDWSQLKRESWAEARFTLAHFAYFNWGPDGWFCFEKINLCRRYDDYSGRILEASNNRIQLASIDAYNLYWQDPAPRHPFLQHHYFASYNTTLRYLAQRTATHQTSADFAHLGCALERYWLAKGTYPKSLVELVPEYAAKVPNDVLTGESYHYRWDDKDHYLLYSPGFGGKDEGGTARTNKSSRIVEGDWLWRGGTGGTPPP